MKSSPLVKQHLPARITEALALLSLLVLLIRFGSGGIDTEILGVEISVHRWSNPLLVTGILLVLHLIISRGHCFELTKQALSWGENTLCQLLEFSGKVHPLLRMTLFLLLLLLTGWLSLPREPGVRRLVHQDDAVLEFNDPAIDFQPPRLRRQLWLSDRLHMEWKGFLFTPDIGDYELAVEGDGIYELRINGQKIVENQPDWRVERKSAKLNPGFGNHPFQILYKDIAYQSTLRFMWKKDHGQWQPIPAAHLGGEKLSLHQVRAGQRKALFLPWFMGLLVFFLWHELRALQKKYALLSGEKKHLWQKIFVILLLVIAFGWRLLILVRTEAMTHADEAIVGLMAKHIAEFKAFPLVYYGQDYNGTLLSWLLAPMQWLLGHSVWNLKLATASLSTLLVYLIYRVGRKWMSPEAGLVAATLTAIAPVMCTVYGLMALVGPIEGAVLAVILIDIALPIFRDKKSSSERIFLLGLVAGVALWNNLQILYYLLPLALFLALSGKSFWKKIHWAIFGSILGALPLVAYNLQSGFPIVDLFLSGGDNKNVSTIFSQHLVGTGLPHLLGSRVRWDRHNNFTFSPLPFLTESLFYIGCLALTLTAMIRLIWQKDRITTFRNSPAAFLLVFFASVVFFYLRSDYGEYYPRYIFTIFPMISLLFGWLIVKKMRPWPTLASLLFLIPLLQNITGNLLADPFYFSQPVHFIDQGLFLPRKQDQLIRFLEENNLTRVHADYWIAFPLAYESSEGILAECDRDRIPGYREAVLASERPARIFHTHHGWLEAYEDLYVRRLGYHAGKVPPYQVYWPKEPLIPRSEWKITASHNPDTAELAADGDTTFFSHWQTPLQPEEEGRLEIDLGQTREISTVLVLRGWSWYDDPREEGLVEGQLWLSVDGENWNPMPPFEKDPSDHIDQFRFDPIEARYVRLTNRSPGKPHLWKVYDIFVQ